MKLIRQIVALCMALVILVSTTGLAMSEHFCGGELQDIAFFGQAKVCEAHVKQVPPCHHEQVATGAQVNKKSCCEDKTVISQQQETLAQTVLKELQPDLSFVAVIASYLLVLTSEHTPQVAQHTNYIPPLIEYDIPVLVQSFLL